ncbi:hypothetical protein GF359_10340 [candidate division WOR-3 bacterium]|uniref:Uncharacterized protein n=1 Tax=candidate division WOR-3 bacterium TaxID=2052148 RepID=A0A9D5KCD2_UNCW3|nr:hypothetical protein [candidate division WOR-3 bacterium]MBD3365599.1 hypothetical protein [candidate division WOR-3 bacterium]
MKVNNEICSWKEANQALGRLGRIEERLNKLRQKADERIRGIEERLGEASAEFLSEAYNLKQGLERFFRENSEGMRSRSLPSGRIGLRNSTCLEIKRPETTLHRLRERGLGDCIRIRQEIDRQALRNLDAETLHNLGVKKVTREAFYITAANRKD